MKTLFAALWAKGIDTFRCALESHSVADAGNLAGIGMILDLLDRFRALERENQWLRAQQ